MSIGLTREEYEDEWTAWEEKVEQAFYAGYRACYNDVEDYDHDIDEMMTRRYMEWLK